MGYSDLGDVRALDGSNIWYNGYYYDPFDPNRPPTKAITIDHSGVKYDQTSQTHEDTNGNTVNGDDQSISQLSQITDALGRVLPPLIPSSDTTGCAGPLSVVFSQLLTIPGSGGGTRQIKLCYVRIHVKTNFGMLDGEGVPIAETAGQFSFIQDAIVYDGTSWSNSPSWIFEYNNGQDGQDVESYADLTKITTPAGGSISYTWRTGSDPNCWSSLTTVSRWVASRTLDANDGTGPHTYRYSAWNTNGAASSLIVTDPSGNDVVHTFASLMQCSPYETQTQWFQGPSQAGALLKTIDTSYQYKENPYDIVGDGSSNATNVFPTKITTTLPDGRVSQVVKVYDNLLSFSVVGVHYNGWSYGKVMDEYEYDWGNGAPGALLHHTGYSYMAFNHSAYMAANLMDKVEDVTVYDGSGAQVAFTHYGYDEYRLAASGVTTQHDNSIANPGVRGNLTSVTRYLNTTGELLTTTTTYYDTGMPYQVTDSNGNITTFSYSTDFAGAYLTKTQLPDTGSVHHVTSGSYDFDTGLLTTFTDQNKQSTNYAYDALSRLTSASFPDGGKTKFSYPDLVTVKKERKQDAGTWITDYSYSDGLGRMTQSQHVDPDEGDEFVETTYDVLGRVATVSNPHRNTASTTDGITTTSYDALGRVVAVKRQDGDVVQTEYAGNRVTVTDEAGNKRRTRSDGLGRLIEVDEPIRASQDTSATGVLNVGGSLQNLQLPGTPATSAAVTIDIGGQEQAVVDTTACEYVNGKPTHCPTVWDIGTLSIAVNGYTASFGYGKLSTPTGLAAGLANAFNADGASPVSASSSGSTVYLTAKAGGAFTNYAFAASSVTVRPDLFSSLSFNTFAPGPTLTGGNDAIPGPMVFDSGSAWLTVGTFTATVNYGGGVNDNSSVAGALAQVFNSDSGSPVTAAVSGSGVTLTSKIPGERGNVSATGGSTTAQPQYFASPSFSVNFSGMGGGSDGSPFGTSAITKYSYDSLDNLTRVEQWGTSGSCDPNCRVRTFEYDSLSRLLKATNPETGAIGYSYDNAGNLISKTDARGNTINFSPGDSPIDALNRVTKKTYSTGNPAVIYSYDQTAYNDFPITNGIGRRTGMSDASGATAWSYDAMGRTSVEQQTINGITKSSGYKYDLAGNVINLTYPDGELVIFGYNGAGRPTSAVDNNLALTFATRATYAPGGELTGVVYGSSGGVGGVTETDSYNQRLQPVSISGAIPSQTVFSLGYDFHVGHGDNGNVYQIANNRDSNRTQNFSYDGLNRLQSAWTNGPKWGETFTIDVFGNLTSKGPVDGKNNHESGLNGAEATIQNQLPGLKYDANGNLIKNGDATYVYDAENRITSSTAGVTYTYNGDGTRVMRSDGTIDWGPGPLSRSDLSGTVSRNFVFFAGKRIARRLIPANTVDYMFSDHLGSLGVMTDAAGKIEGESDYYPFGGEQVISGGLTAYKFTGKEHDAESGLDYFGARHYSSMLGRFMSPDWSAVPALVPYADLSDPQTLNLYGYVRNNPMSNRDADGHSLLGDRLRDAWQDAKDFGKSMTTLAVCLYGCQTAKDNKGLNAAVGVALSGQSLLKTFQTYTKTNLTTGEVYSGRTSGTGTPEENVAARDADHHLTEKGFGPAKIDQTSSNSDAIRGREQQLIEANGGAKSDGGTSGNAINGISQTNPNREAYMNAAEREFSTVERQVITIIEEMPK